MLVVAENLTAEALRRSDEDEVDLFGRSAFSRYYYAAFWIIRDFLGFVDPSWTEAAHKNIPALINESLIKKIDRELKKRTIPAGQREKLKHIARTNANEIANMLNEARTIRIKADYNVDTCCVKNASVIEIPGELGTTKSSDAARWLVIASKNTKKLLDVCKKVGLV